MSGIVLSGVVAGPARLATGSGRVAGAAKELAGEVRPVANLLAGPKKPAGLLPPPKQQGGSSRTIYVDGGEVVYVDKLPDPTIFINKGGEAIVGSIPGLSVSVYGFRGTGKFSMLKKAKPPHPYEVTGHVTYSFDKGKTMWGFGPNTKGVSEPMELLKRYGSLPGQVSDDTLVMHNISRRAVPLKDGSPQTIYEFVTPVTPMQFRAIVEKHNSFIASQPSQVIRYKFPEKGEVVQFKVPGLGICYNCATFPHELGIKLPHNSGRLGAYIPELVEKGKIWKPK